MMIGIMIGLCKDVIFASFVEFHEKPRELPNKVFCPNTKNNFTNVIIVGALVGLCPRGLQTDIKKHEKVKISMKKICIVIQNKKHDMNIHSINN